MTLIAYLDFTGKTKAWANPRTGWFYGSDGKAVGLVWFDGFFDPTGRQIGFWRGNYVVDLRGNVWIARRGAKIWGLAMPRERKMPAPPKIIRAPTRPALERRSSEPVAKRQWAEMSAADTARERLADYVEAMVRHMDHL